MVRLNDKPFYLSDEKISWVTGTLKSMSEDEKIGQLFCPMGFSGEHEYLDHLIDDMKVGGIMYRPAGKEDIQEAHRYIQENAKIPFLLAANAEAGGDGISLDGTSMGKPLGVAATGDPENAYRMGKVACREGAAVGMNWAFAPIVDIDRNFRNPITNVRCFGSDPAKVYEYAAAYLRAAKEQNIAVAIKHFPGDGCDERDQHLLTSINDLSCEEWDTSYGMIYHRLIEDGAQTVMAGHIAQPAWVRRINPEATSRECLYPGSLSHELITGLLRERLGFNGVVSTDATPMVGFGDAVPRSEAIPKAIQAGCDIILFNKSLEEDMGFIRAALEDGRLTWSRIDEAVTRILALKASLDLPEKKSNGTIVPGSEAFSVIGCDEHLEWANGIADQSITLVKDREGLLPLSPERYPRIYLNVVQRDPDPANPLVQNWKERFEKEGFSVEVRDRSVTVGMEHLMNIPAAPQKVQERIHEMYRSVGEFRDSMDLYVYIANIENASNNTTARLDWRVAFGLGDDLPWFSREKPTVFISVANPYHLFDVPMVDTFINAYHSTDIIADRVMDKLMGRSDFKGSSPIDPFCGNKYLKEDF